MGRRLGQHFLHDPAILDRIVDALNPTPDDVVVEVGAGRGTLTQRLARKVSRVISIEKDRELVAELLNECAMKPLPSNVRVLHGDALSVDWFTLAAETFEQTPPSPEFKVVGNIPYAITAPLIEKALQPPVPVITVYLIQREVAERLSAEEGSRAYGALTVGVRAVANVERLFGVRPGSFSPPPAVDSAVVRLTPLAEPLVPVSERLEFRQFVTAIFGQRRKQLSRAVRTVTGLEKADADAVLQRMDVSTTARPEVLSPSELLRLFRTISEVRDGAANGS